MRGYSRVIILGNLTSDPELRYLPSGTPVSSFTVAINRTYTSASGERKEETSFIPVEVMGKYAERVNQFLRRGSPVFVEGRLRQRTWETPEGQRRSEIKIIGLHVEFLPKVEPKEKVPELELETTPEFEEVIDEEEIPF